MRIANVALDLPTIMGGRRKQETRRRKKRNICVSGVVSECLVDNSEKEFWYWKKQSLKLDE